MVPGIKGKIGKEVREYPRLHCIQMYDVTQMNLMHYNYDSSLFGEKKCNVKLNICAKKLFD